MKTLCILRHAEAQPPGQAADDANRMLTPYGLEQCADRAQQASIRYQRVIASPAVRTATTARLVFGSEPVPEPRLYNAPWHTILRLVAAMPETLRSLAVVGHNPGISQLAEYLTGQPQRLSPAGMLIFEVGGEWARTAPSTVRLVTARVD